MRSVVVVSEAEVDLAELLRATVEALGTMDVVALERLSAEAEKISSRRVAVSPAAAVKVREFQGALGELLQSTERSLRMLRGLHDAGLRKMEEDATWDR